MIVNYAWLKRHGIRDEMAIMNAKKEALKIVTKLQKAGFIAYFAGGCVRDLLMGKKPADFDVATSAKPTQVEKLFPKTKPVGKKFGVILVIEGGHRFEVTTFRGEKEYKDARRPSKVYWSDPKEDAKRRDFTCNGIFYDPVAKKYLDFVGGRKDIKNKILRFIGNAEERINEDHLRILRAVRFKNCLGFQYDQEMKNVLPKFANQIKTVSSERIRMELDKILLHPSRNQAFRDLDELGILPHILPEIVKMKGVEQPAQFHDEGDVWEHTLLCLKNLPKKVSLATAWGTLLHDVGKPDTFAAPGEIMKVIAGGQQVPTTRITFYRHTKVGAEIARKIAERLRFSKEMREKVVWLVKNHLRFKDLPNMKQARQIKFINHPYIADLLEISRADSLASFLGSEGPDLTLYNYAKKLYDQESKKPRLKKMVTGDEVMQLLKIEPGPLVGKVLKALEEAQLEGKIKTKKQALEFIRDLNKNE